MNVSLYHAAAGLTAADRWQEVIGENMAGSSIPGFKRQDLSFAAIQAGMMQPGAQAGSRPQPFAIPKAAVTTNFSPGELRYSGARTDVALEGGGFFAVQLPDGHTGYTRDGEFKVSAAGQLVTKQGFPVLGSNGPIQLDPRNPTAISISAKGEITQGIDVKGSLKVVSFDDPQKLTQAGGGMYLATNPEIQKTDATNAVVRQGYLESSNTTPLAEMAHMMSAMRTFETNQRMIQLHDERLNKAISELGSTT